MSPDDVATPPRVSVCICTRNRPEELLRCLDSLDRSSRPVDETIVADDGTDERTAQMLKEGGTRWRVKYVEGPRRGLGANRNAALRSATGDYILFLDDDACLGERFLEDALTCLASSRVAVGQTVISGCENNRGVIVKAHDQSFLGFQNVPYADGAGLNTIVINSTLFPTGLFEVARFDENLVYGCDEVDIALQAVMRGYRIIHCDGAVNFHYPSQVNRSYYAPHLDVSRLYITFKRYAVYERSYLKATAFAAVAPMHCVIASIKRRGLAGIEVACPAVASAARLCFETLRRDVWSRSRG